MLKILQLLQLLQHTLTAELRERTAEDSQISSNSSDSEWLLAFSDWLLAPIGKLSELSLRTPFYVGNVVTVVVVGATFWAISDICGESSKSGAGIVIGSVPNVAVDAVVAVENRSFLSHLQRLVVVKMRRNLTPNPSPKR